MTAEIAILNREAVAMAADSAATMSTGTGQKILSSANKVFALSKHQPVGIMIFGSALFMGIPWETIIKSHRRKIGAASKDSLKEYAEEFIEFIKNSTALFPQSEQDLFVSHSIYSYFSHLRKEIEYEVDEQTEKKTLSKRDIQKISETIINASFETWKKGDCNIPNCQSHIDVLKTKYKDVIEKAIRETYEQLPLTSKSKQILHDLAGYLFVSFPKEVSNTAVSGIVISGFGELELFPSLISYSVEGIANNILKYKEDAYQKIDFNNTALVMPFAQQEMVVTFMDGVSEIHAKLYEHILNETMENYPKIIVDLISPNMTDKKKKDLLKKIKKIGSENLKKGLDLIDNIQQTHFVEPILQVVTFLSKGELAEMAESLVNLTCLRKKISTEEETVGGMIDVAVISKGDGLIWIKRKHYFKPELNQHFFTNYLNK